MTDGDWRDATRCALQSSSGSNEPHRRFGLAPRTSRRRRCRYTAETFTSISVFCASATPSDTVHGTCRAVPGTGRHVPRTPEYCVSAERKALFDNDLWSEARMLSELHGTCRAAFPHATVFPVASVQPAGAQRLFAASRYPSYARRTSPSESPANLSRNARAISNATTFSITTLAAATALMSLRS